MEMSLVTFSEVLDSPLYMAWFLVLLVRSVGFSTCVLVLFVPALLACHRDGKCHMPRGKEAQFLRSTGSSLMCAESKVVKMVERNKTGKGMMSLLDRQQVWRSAQTSRRFSLKGWR